MPGVGTMSPLPKVLSGRPASVSRTTARVWPVPPDETEVVEEGDPAAADVPVKGDATEVVPLSIPRDEDGHLDLSEGPQRKN